MGGPCLDLLRQRQRGGQELNRGAWIRVLVSKSLVHPETFKPIPIVARRPYHEDHS
jgi:hypothetical protein